MIKNKKSKNALTFQESMEYMINPLEFFENNKDRFRKILESKYGKNVDLVDYDLKNIEEEARKRGNMESDKVCEIVEESIKAAYKRMYGTDENCVVKIAEDYSHFDVYKKQIVVEDDDQADALLEMTLSEAKELNADAEVGDEMLNPVDINSFNRIAVMNGKQRCKQETREFARNTVYATWKSKEHKIIVGYVLRTDSKTGDIFVDLGGSIEGRLPHSAQIPNEMFKKDDKIKCYLEEVRQNDRGIDILLSRASAEFVRLLFALNVPEIGDGVVEIFKVSRKAGYRTKVAVYTNTPEVDPVGSCVGMNGVRITAVMNEISGEKIDIVPYDPDPKVFIEASLAPASVEFVRIVDENARRAYAVVEDSQLAYAIGKGGDNVRLANKLTDWLCDIKTQEQYNELGLDKDIKENAEKLFDNTTENPELSNEEEVTEEENAEEEYYFKDFPFIASVVQKLADKGFESINKYFDSGIEDPSSYFGFTEDEKANFEKVLADNFDVSDEE